MENDSWFEKIPKVELHVHLEGAIPYVCLLELVRKYRGDEQILTIHDLKEKFHFNDFQHFIETWIWKNNFLREYEDFEYVAKAVADDMENQNIRYAEVFYSPPDFKKHGLKTQDITQFIRRGFDRNSNIKIGLIPDLVRDFGPEMAADTIEEIKEVAEYGIIGIGLGGTENKHPAKQFSKVFQTAKELGFSTTVHAGEAAGSESVWESLVYLKPDRIGHGTRALEDDKLVDYLVKINLPIEMCPISNIKIGIVEDIYHHPVRDFYDKGIVVTINTDDPKMFGNSLADEYHLLFDKLNFSKDDIRNIILNGIKSSWLSQSEKHNLKDNFINDLAW